MRASMARPSTLVDYLQDEGCTVVGQAQSLERAKLLAAVEECDAALVDGNLAGRPVDDIARALRNRRIPFAFVTGYGREALPRGFDKRSNTCSATRDARAGAANLH